MEELRQCVPHVAPLTTRASAIPANKLVLDGACKIIEVIGLDHEGIRTRDDVVAVVFRQSAFMPLQTVHAIP